ncbi:MAG: acylphosphatase [Oculatellaceae cyanobacterium Prado106]|jgi:acylphosphatase|nr:acylphosphatase [Oculatellaceae cyanobacterium Prado106]
MNADLKRAHVLISGKVQGVGYRASTWDMAQLLHLNGWVRNLRDGRVEAVFEGAGDRIEEIIRWCHQGPPVAQVKQVEVEYENPEGIKGFEVERTR